MSTILYPTGIHTYILQLSTQNARDADIQSSTGGGRGWIWRRGGVIYIPTPQQSYRSCFVVVVFIVVVFVAVIIIVVVVIFIIVVVVLL